MPRSLLISLAVLLVACGQSGPLYLPQAPSPPVVATPTQSGAPRSGEQEQSKDKDADAVPPPASTPAPSVP